MAETLSIPNALYDYILYFECATKDWLDLNKKTSVKGDGSLINAINWNSSYSIHEKDAGGKTLFGVTESTWNGYVDQLNKNNKNNKGYKKEVNNMGFNGWNDIIYNFWTSAKSHKCANYACAFVMFQMIWGGFTKDAQNNTANILISNADKKDYPFSSSTNGYTKMADATHAYTDPMVAYEHLRKALARYYYNKSASGDNVIFRCGWLTRSVLAFTPYGLYIPIPSYTNEGLEYGSAIEEWEAVKQKWLAENKSRYVKIFDWGASPEFIKAMTNSSYYPGSYYNSYDGGYSSGGVYNGLGGVYQLGSYSNAVDPQRQQQVARNRESVLNTLIGGSTNPESVKRCNELLTTDKKKGNKIKSEN